MKHAKIPFISVIIPALNEEAYLARTLESLSHQSFRNFEVIVVDNNSTDMTAEVAADYHARVISQVKPGVCAARDAGTLVARGQIIVSTDADTTFKSDWLAKIAAEFRNEDVVLVAGPPQFVSAPLWGRIYASGLFGMIGLWYKLTGQLFYISAANLAFRCSLWTGYNTHLTQGGDELYVLRQMRDRGTLRWLGHNPVLTSSRRMKRGLLYNLLVTFMGYYLGDYFISKLTKRSFFGSYPPIRDHRGQRALGWKIASFAIVLIALVYNLESHPEIAHALATRGNHLRHLHHITLHIDADGRKF